jgi:diguanylate cyclase
MIGQAARRGTPVAALFIDLDDFKLVNDTLGHGGGDELLKQTARRLCSTIRGDDTVGRISGDEFIVLLRDLSRPEDAALVAQKIIDCLAEPFNIAGNETFISASIGIATYPADGANPEALLAAADAAMYGAKQSGRNSFQFFTAEIDKRTRARASLGSELRRALERREFVVYYQPKVDFRSRLPCGAEALLRWRHPERGLVSPAEFVPLLEEMGLIVPVGEWVLSTVCADVKALPRYPRPLPLAVNLSARQFRQPDLDARIRRLIEDAGINAGMLELEITESQLMNDPQQAIRTMQALRAAGIEIAIDDFGTGYSSLAYLTRFPVSTLKIDRSFVKDMLHEKSQAAIVRTVIEMAQTLRFKVVAEGVETQAQADFLASLGCEQGQGYLFARPMPVEDLMAFISRHTATSDVESPQDKPVTSAAIRSARRGLAGSAKR